MRLCLGVLALMLACGAARAADLEVVLTGVHPGPGPLKVGLFRGPENFAEPAGSVGGLSLTANGPTVRGVLHDVPPGWVAVLIHHDENQNGEMDRLFGLVPLEGYGFSGKDVPRPTWDSARFLLPKEGGVVTVKMRYPTSAPP
ncbi:DUF2141 domain-containing protein [Pararhodospirillum photometricum]|uniref:DUF2141 domain-containing protein n=1 Tax=Pararhodospirillum photometricum TaxID=1084 RepID=UPI0002DC7C5A|nr:DUF2141 domain-containing protein [Pararhodospirillum photometricum]